MSKHKIPLHNAVAALKKARTSLRRLHNRITETTFPSLIETEILQACWKLDRAQAHLEKYYDNLRSLGLVGIRHKKKPHFKLPPNWRDRANSKRENGK